MMMVRAKVFTDAYSGFTQHYAERYYVERFTVTPCSEQLVTTHSASLRIREDLGLVYVHLYSSI